MDGTNPYEAPRDELTTRRSVRRGNSASERTFGCVFSILGFGAGVSVFWIRDRRLSIGAVIPGLVAAVIANIVGRLIGRAISADSIPDEPTAEERRADAKRQKLQAEIEVARDLLVQAKSQDDEELKAKLTDYLGRLERKLTP